MGKVPKIKRYTHINIDVTLGCECVKCLKFFCLQLAMLDFVEAMEFGVGFVDV